jgi:hypothetical protein
MGFSENLKADVLLATCLQLFSLLFIFSQCLLFSSFAACWYEDSESCEKIGNLVINGSLRKNYSLMVNVGLLTKLGS